jgi:DNA-binding CsgD family transcriptional regulator
MFLSDLQKSQAQLEKIMDIAVTLADCTHSPELAAQIPACLSRTLELEPITLAVVRHTDSQAAPEIVLLNSSGELACGDATASLAERILEIHRQFKPADAPGLRSPFAVGNAQSAACSDLAVNGVPDFPRALVFAHPLDEQNHLYLVLHRRGEQGPLWPAQVAALTLIASQLAKLLGSMIAWQERPNMLGVPFGTLTVKEWTVLRALNSDEGEKQLAERLQLSPHTLHSHIKSIYRKVGVQGRLPLLQRLNAAVRDLRRGASATVPGEVEPPTYVAAACG